MKILEKKFPLQPEEISRINEKISLEGFIDTHIHTSPDIKPRVISDMEAASQASAEKMDPIPDHSVHLMVTSPPYNVSKEYDEDLTLGEYLEFLQRVFRETYRVLVHGGRACINVANLGRKPYIPMKEYLVPAR